jgi:hypothetical protein
MINVERIDTQSKSQVRRFVLIPFELYKNHPCWVPPLFMDAEMQLNRNKHPFYEHSDADFFIAVQNGADVGRIAALENRRYNHYHQTHTAQFYLFDCVDDTNVAEALFSQVFEWAARRELNVIIGPKGFGPLDGYGILADGFEHRQMMTMMNYNYPYYPKLVEMQGFEKEVDFVSCYIRAADFQLPERVHRIARRIQERGNLRVHRFKNKNELKKWVPQIGDAYNRAFVNNWEYYPLTQNEIDFVMQNVQTVADPRLIKIITHDEEVVGFLFGWRDVSAGLQRARGRLFPLGLIYILLDMRRTKWVAMNGAGILPEFQGRGGNALLYAEMEYTIHDYSFEHADLTQVAETALQMRQDLENLGGKAYKNHRVYRKQL